MAKTKSAKPAPPIKSALRVVYRKVADLVPYAKNARTHDAAQVKKIAASMREFRWTNPVLVDKRGGIIAGHGRVLAAKQLGLTEVPTIAIEHLSERQKRAYIIADNRIAEEAGWDKSMLRVELRELAALKVDLTTTGFDMDAIDRLLKTGEDGRDPNEVPPPPVVATSRLGDVWEMGGLSGRHRVICGDSTDPAVLERLCHDGAADMLCVDPPFNCDIGGKAQDQSGRKDRGILNDKMSGEAFGKFIRAAMAAAAGALKPGAPAYVFHGDGEGINFRQAFAEAGFYQAACLIWRKNALVLGRGDFHQQHESILYGWKDGAAHPWFGDRDKTTMQELSEPAAQQTGPDEWQICVGERTIVIRGKDIECQSVGGTVLWEDKPARSDLHPTQKPVPLLLRLIRNSSAIGDKVLDTFGGSGSTLIACHLGQRVARICELDEKYVDVICRRFQEQTGLEATLDGVPFDQVAAERAAPAKRKRAA